MKNYRTKRRADLWANKVGSKNNIDWRDKLKEIPDPETDQRRAMIDSTITQLKGKKEENSCSRCISGLGPFESCVRLQSEDGKFTLNGRCANCHAYNQGPNCDLPGPFSAAESTPEIVCMLQSSLPFGQGKLPRSG